MPTRVRALFAAFSARDWDAFLADVDPDVEWAPLDENRVYRGRNAVAKHLERRLDRWVEFRLELESAEVSPEEDRILAAGRYRGRVLDSGKLLSGSLFAVIEMRAGRFWRGEEYQDRESADQAFRWRE